MLFYFISGCLVFESSGAPLFSSDTSKNYNKIADIVGFAEK